MSTDEFEEVNEDDGHKPPVGYDPRVETRMGKFSAPGVQQLDRSRNPPLAALEAGIQFGFVDCGNPLDAEECLAWHANRLPGIALLEHGTGGIYIFPQNEPRTSDNLAKFTLGGWREIRPVPWWLGPTGPMATMRIKGFHASRHINSRYDQRLAETNSEFIAAMDVILHLGFVVIIMLIATLIMRRISQALWAKAGFSKKESLIKKRKSE